MTIPPIPDIRTAIRIYYTKTQLGCQDIEELFQKRSSSTKDRLKKIAREKMIEENVPIWNASTVSTEVAYRAWGLDIKNLERRYKKLRELGIMYTDTEEECGRE